MKQTVSDILNCLANLSSDEVFTSPELANRMLDMLPQDIFSDPNAKFLDPCSKSGVFLREIAKRLLVGLEKQIPDLQQRIDHIMSKQLFGVALTLLTAEMSRRTLYCTKKADGEYSVATKFKDKQGNLRYMRCEHTWVNGKCNQCGANRAQYDRVETMENYAYPFIHKNINEIFKNMQFDVIIGNPPYQMTTAGDDNGAQAKPIYQKFVSQALKLNSNYLIMITPSRWFVGGWGLDDYRDIMISCNHIEVLHDYKSSTDCFSGVDIKGGVSYFLYNKNFYGPCRFYYHDEGGKVTETTRFLKEKDCDILIRYNELISIYRKTRDKNFVSFSSIVSERSPYGLNTNHTGEAIKTHKTDCQYFERTGVTFMSKSKITKNLDSIDKYKIFVPKAAEDGKLPGKVIGKITQGTPGMICSGTYLLIGPCQSKEEMTNMAKYMATKFFRALVAVNKISQDAYSKVYKAVPLQDFSHPWTDEMLYKKYGLSEEEIAFIESMIKPME